MKGIAADPCDAPPGGAARVWRGSTQPSPRELTEAAYDVPCALPPRHKLLICAGPRTGSTRLARLLLGAGLGIPMEYWNPLRIKALSRRWGIRSRDYLATLYAKRTSSQVFASNLQARQIEQWPHAGDWERLFDGAQVIHLVRPDRIAQAASLATSYLTGAWGFEASQSGADPVARAKRRLRDLALRARQALNGCRTGPIRPHGQGMEGFSGWQIEQAARRAVRELDAEEQFWKAWFRDRGIRPLTLAMDQTLGKDLGWLEGGIAQRFGLPFDPRGAERMLRCDRGKYVAHAVLKAHLHQLIADGLP